MPTLDRFIEMIGFIFSANPFSANVLPFENCAAEHHQFSVKPQNNFINAAICVLLYRQHVGPYISKI